MDFLVVNLQINFELENIELMYTTKIQGFLYLWKNFKHLMICWKYCRVNSIGLCQSGQITLR